MATKTVEIEVETPEEYVARIRSVPGIFGDNTAEAYIPTPLLEKVEADEAEASVVEEPEVEAVEEVVEEPKAEVVEEEKPAPKKAPRKRTTHAK